MTGTTYVLFGMTARDATSASETDAFPTGGRERWTLELRIAAITGTLTVAFQVSPTGEDGTWVTVATFSETAAGTYKLDGTIDVGETDAFTTKVNERDVYVRAEVTAITTATFELAARAPWLDVTFGPHTALLSQELRNWEDGLQRVVDTAELDVTALIVRRDEDRVGLPVDYFPTMNTVDPHASETLLGAPRAQLLDANLTMPGFGRAMLLCIAAQAEHLYQLERLKIKSDKEAQVTWRKMPRLAPGVARRLAPFRHRTKTVFFGR